MTFPLLSTTYVDPELVTSANLYSRVLSVINTLGGFLYGEAEGTSSNTVTLSSAATNFVVPTATVTFVLTQQRRIRFVVAARMQGATAAAPYTIQCAYVAGGSATLSGATVLGQSGAAQVATTGTGGTASQTARAEHTALLAAGTWTAFGAAQRVAGGGATDTSHSGYCAVYDAGNT